MQFAVCRPYGERIRKRVFSFLDSMGYELGAGLVLAPGRSNAVAAQWIRGLPNVDLLLIPFHVHRTESGDLVDGIGVLSLINDLYVNAPRPTLMPVSHYSLKASFPRRLDELRDAAPAAERFLLPMREDQIGSPTIRAELARVRGECG